MQTELTVESINILLKELANEVYKQIRKGINKNYIQNIDIYLVGGAAIMLQLGSRTSTLDIDAYYQETGVVKDAIRTTAYRNNLDIKWLNRDFTRSSSFTYAILEATRVYKQYRGITIWVANLDLLLCMKLIACRNSEGRHDLQDIIDIRNNISGRLGRPLTKNLVYLWLNTFYPVGDIN